MIRIRGGWLEKLGFTIVSHAGQSQQQGTTCTEVTGVNETCVNNQLPIGKKMGPWTPGNNCNNFVDNIFKKCKTCAPESDDKPFPSSFGPCAKVNGQIVCAATGI